MICSSAGKNLLIVSSKKKSLKLAKVADLNIISLSDSFICGLFSFGNDFHVFAKSKSLVRLGCALC